EKVGSCTAELRIAGSRSVEVRFLAADGKAAVQLHARIKTSQADVLKRLKREAKDASVMLATQALRLERLFVGERGWPLKVWRERYVNHPLVGSLARRLIWQFD